ncbi:MAG: flavodoxin-dependent (E)-4-hydroxy-3-methylbut-2-enyl-diphosphate synthase [Kiritimatiellia bacterium]|nr:flavodoxin-dependent (E)-4-hydroxy-3-methylbut-2-enyl-diphosphate synthase [Kiritimatiellia bacterium]MDP6809095.1 flavodoxin-dependent (E)-4-hydroxy-3-methylbut-2-enyl-diphosphate synthase [Kiritimatiellia bacterium]MDP7023213.1 flavodoxin-dependent (E)-4-hydroxy-3-methylbut-2-enyl-diphosphate synthase [Kiritimatiellia bacterium]
MKRRPTRQIHVGSVPVGGDAPVSVQTMTKTDTRDVDATVEQINEVATLGCDIVRLAVIDEAAASALGEIKKQTSVPLIADIHFDHRLALAALAQGVDGLRINPGNIGGADNVRTVVDAARERMVPIRIGVNAGSLENDLLEAHGGATAEALVESAMRHVRLLEACDYRAIKISVKASDVERTLAAYRLLSQRTDYPLHLGVTEAGTFMAGTVRSSVALGILLEEGIGDTIRISLTDTPAREVRVGLELLRALDLRAPGASVISCPTCGRVHVNVVELAGRVESALDEYYAQNPNAARPLVAVMGCMVNGPGEAREADIAVAGGKGKFALYLKGEHLRTVEEGEALDALMEEVRTFEQPNSRTTK